MSFSSSNLIALVLILHFSYQPFCQSSPVKSKKQATEIFQQPDVFLTVSSNAEYEGEGSDALLFDRKLELNWYNFLDSKTDDLVGLYLEDPLSSNNLNAVESVSVNASTGYFLTSVRYTRQDLTSSSDRCLGYWIAYVRDQSVLKSRCITISPTWMNDIRDVIGNRPLSSLMIPGTHDAGAWRHYDGRPSESILISYVMCQEDSIYQQLIHGIRFLDIRVAHYPGTPEKFWVNHDQVRLRPLSEVLSEIKTFVSESNEIVFIDFHRFPVGFDSSEVHQQLVEFVRGEIGSLLASKSLTINATPNDLWKSNKTIILSYAEGSIVSQYDFLWPNAQHAWAETNQLESLENYLSTSLNDKGCKGEFWSAMAELTPTASDILLRPNYGLRGFAAEANAKLSYWYRQSQWYSKSFVVSTDYYLGNDIINISIEVNRNNAVCP